jgi:NitT/TauT family transport system permease protein
VTLGETLVGFGLAVIAGSVAAFFLYQWPTLAEVCRPFITALNNLPRIALTPLFVLWLGFGPASRVALVISLSFFVVLLSGLAGLQSANPEHLRLARLLGASRVQSVVTFVLPGALPTYFAGLQLALTYAFLGAVVGEMLAGAGGLGGEIQLSIATYRTDDFFAALLLVAVMATILSALLQLLERRFLGWREGTQP